MSERPAPGRTPDPDGSGSSGSFSIAATTRIGVSVTVAPLADIRGNLATLLGQALLDLLGMFYPPSLGKKVNVAVTELIQNVMANALDPDSSLGLELCVDEDALIVRVRNKASLAQFEAVRARVDALARCPEPKRLFTDTLRARRQDGLKGGLGLMRLVAENRFRLGVSYEQEHLTMQATFPLLRGTP